MAKDKECKKCGRTSNVVNISQECPFCPKEEGEKKECCEKCYRYEDSSCFDGKCPCHICPCHSPKQEQKTRGYSYCPKCEADFFISHACKDYQINANSPQPSTNWEEEFAMKFVPNCKIGNVDAPDWYKGLEGTTANYITLKSYIRSLLSKQRAEIIEKIEGMKLKNENAIDKLEEVDERARITNLLNENMVFGYQQALEDIKSIIKEK